MDQAAMVENQMRRNQTTGDASGAVAGQPQAYYPHPQWKFRNFWIFAIFLNFSPSKISRKIPAFSLFNPKLFTQFSPINALFLKFFPIFFLKFSNFPEFRCNAISRIPLIFSNFFLSKISFFFNVPSFPGIFPLFFEFYFNIYFVIDMNLRSQPFLHLLLFLFPEFFSDFFFGFFRTFWIIFCDF